MDGWMDGWMDGVMDGCVWLQCGIEAKRPEEEEEDESMDVQPMTPLFSNTTALMKRRPTTSGSSALPSTPKAVGDVGDVSDASSNDPPRVSARIPSAYSDPLDGYLSEGGASLYARKLNYVAQRNKDDHDR